MSDSAPRPATDQQWDELLRQLRTQPLAQPRPYFYGRVQARLAVEARQPWLPGWMCRPAYVLLLGALVLALSGDDVALAAGATTPTASAPAPR